MLLNFIGIIELSFSTALLAYLSSRILTPSFRLDTLGKIFSSACVT